jgi:hypothetical protein
MGRARKKPVEIEFLRLDGTEAVARGVAAWIGSGGHQAEAVQQWVRVEKSIVVEEDWLGAEDWNSDGWWPVDRAWGVKIKTLEGVMLAEPRDFVIQGVQGEFYPCKPGIFAETYDIIEGNTLTEGDTAP